MQTINLRIFLCRSLRNKSVSWNFQVWTQLFAPSSFFLIVSLFPGLKECCCPWTKNFFLNHFWIFGSRPPVLSLYAGSSEGFVFPMGSSWPIMFGRRGMFLVRLIRECSLAGSRKCAMSSITPALWITIHLVWPWFCWTFGNSQALAVSQGWRMGG